MNRYETIFISDPDLSEEMRGQLFEKTKDLVEKQNGYLGLFDEWGNKKLAYEIKKKNRGYYVRIDYCGDGPLVNEMERSFRIDDRVLKFMTILLGKDIDLDAVKEEFEKEEAEAAETETATADTKTGAAESEAETEKTEAAAAEAPADPVTPEAVEKEPAPAQETPATEPEKADASPEEPAADTQTP